MTKQTTPPSKLAQWWAKVMNWLGQPSPQPPAPPPPTPESTEYAKMSWADDGGPTPPAEEPPPHP